MKYFMAALSMLFMGTIAAQNVKGKLVDEAGSPIEDAGIFNKTSGQHSHTDGTGHFVLDRTSVSDTIYFSRLGYATKTLVVKQSDLGTSLTIVLDESSISLDQVVLVSEVDTLSRLVDVDVHADPVKSSQEILRSARLRMFQITRKGSAQELVAYIG